MSNRPEDAAPEALDLEEEDDDVEYEPDQGVVNEALQQLEEKAGDKDPALLKLQGETVK
ncbi:MAG: hypothetical protein K2W95_25635 [Candidatus Obscuribacterales bacterium]|nr:hypothetical protein [Candidatus Obscuribacterales bacterium]